MTRWVIPSAIVALLSNLLALLTTLLGNRPTPVVLGLAVVADFAIVVALASRPRVTLPDTERRSREISQSKDTSIRQARSPSREAEPLFGSESEVANQKLTAPEPESEQPASTTPRALQPGSETEDSDTKAGQTERGVPRDANENLLDNLPWLGLVEECVELEDELAGLLEHMDAASQHVVDHTILRLQEVLERAGVEIITNESAFNRVRHKAVPAQPIPAPRTAINATLRPGFAVGSRVLRRARVRVSDAPSLDEGNSSTGGQQ